MARPVPNSVYERESRHVGAASYQYRYGTVAVNDKNVPHWELNLAHNPQYLYCADQYTKDARDLAIAIEIAEHRRGQILIVAFGGAVRRFFDGMDIVEK